MDIRRQMYQEERENELRERARLQEEEAQKQRSHKGRNHPPFSTHTRRQQWGVDVCMCCGSGSSRRRGSGCSGTTRLDSRWVKGGQADALT